MHCHIQLSNLSVCVCVTDELETESLFGCMFVRVCVCACASMVLVGVCSGE